MTESQGEKPPAAHQLLALSAIAGFLDIIGTMPEDASHAQIMERSVQRWSKLASDTAQQDNELRLLVVLKLLWEAEPRGAFIIEYDRIVDNQLQSLLDAAAPFL